MPTIPQRLARAWALLVGHDGHVPRLTRDRQPSRPSLASQAEQLIDAVEGATPHAQIAELHHPLAPRRSQVHARPPRLEPASRSPPTSRRNAPRSPGRGGPPEGRPAPRAWDRGAEIYSGWAPLGRATREPGQRRPLARPARGGGPAPPRPGGRRGEFGGRKPLRRLGQPQSRCGLPGRRVPARDAATGAQEVPGSRPGSRGAVRPAPGGARGGAWSGPDATPRHAARCPDRDDTREGFPPAARGPGRCGRWGPGQPTPWNTPRPPKSRGSGGDLRANHGPVRPPRPHGTGVGGSGAGSRPRGPRPPGGRVGPRSRSSPPRVSSPSGTTPKRCWRRRGPTGPVRRGPRPGGRCSDPRASPRWTRRSGGGPNGAWDPRSCRPWGTWTACVGSRGVGGTRPEAAAPHAGALACTVPGATTRPEGQEPPPRVRGVRRGVGRARRLGESVPRGVRRQPARPRTLSPGLLDLKRLSGKLRRFRVGRRKDPTSVRPAGPEAAGGELLGVPPAEPRPVAAKTGRAKTCAVR